ncbi:helix-turn-helix domain-containing protein [Micrococcus luteus]|uniref:helix-turn-helix domain-containing protein n=1 Tax=Micrococcus luteus TaxID=1270 RepID=UPI003566CE29
MAHTVCAVRISAQPSPCGHRNFFSLTLCAVRLSHRVLPMTNSNEESGSDFNSMVAAEVRAWLARSGKRQADLAAALGVSQSGISHRLRARVAFTLEELATIAEVFDITLAELLGPVILQARRSPRTDMVGAGASARLPRLDSNQQPFD